MYVCGQEGAGGVYRSVTSMAHLFLLEADANRVNMYASTWLCTKTSALSGSPSTPCGESGASTMEQLEI